MRLGVRGLIGVGVAAATMAVGIPAANAANTWTVQPVPLPSGATQATMNAVSCTSAANCEAVVTYNQSLAAAEQWNGSTWTASQPIPGPGDDVVFLKSVSCFSADNCTAVGFAEGNEAVITYAASWNGSTWTFTNSFRTDLSELYGVSCPAANNCTAVGYVNSPGDNPNEPLAEKWNGKIWKDEPVPVPSEAGSGILTSVSCLSANYCLAVGHGGVGIDTATISYLWNGTAWTELTLPAPAGSVHMDPTGVSCTAKGRCEAVGSDSDSSGTGGSFADHWDGSAWTLQSLPLPSGTTFSSLASVSCVRFQCTAAGEYVPTGSTRYPLAEFYNGSTWTVRATAKPSGRKYFSGISCVAATTCTAVGAALPTMPNDIALPLAEQN